MNKKKKIFFEYKVLWYDEDKYDEETFRGITYARDEIKAMKNLHDMYGDNMISVTIAAVGEFGDTVYEFSDGPTCLFSQVVAKDREKN